MLNLVGTYRNNKTGKIRTSKVVSTAVKCIHSEWSRPQLHLYQNACVYPPSKQGYVFSEKTIFSFPMKKVEKTEETGKKWKNSQLTQAGTPAQLLGMIRKQFDENWCTCFSFIVKTFNTPKSWKVLLWQQLLANRNWKLRNSWSSQRKAMLKIWWKSMQRFRL